MKPYYKNAISIFSIFFKGKVKPHPRAVIIQINTLWLGNRIKHSFLEKESHFYFPKFKYYLQYIMNNRKSIEIHHLLSCFPLIILHPYLIFNGIDHLTIGASCLQWNIFLLFSFLLHQKKKNILSIYI